MTTENIVPLRPGVQPEATTAAPEPHEGVINFLERTLQEAREGKVVGLVLAQNSPDWRSSYSIVGFIGGYSMQGAVQCALADIVDINRGCSIEDDD